MRSGPLRLWCTAFLGFWLVIGGWALAAPYDGYPDEIDHVVRAVGVVTGDPTPPAADAKRGTGAFQTVPGGLVRVNCWAFDPTRSAACAEPPSGDRTPVVAPTGAGRYFPPYYAVVGGPLAGWPGWTGLFAARLLTSALSAAFLAGALVTLVRRSRHGLMLAGLLVGFTPMAAYMASAVNPNGLEIAAAVAFFAGAIQLLLGRTAGGSDRALVWLVGLSALALAVLRASSPLWLLVGTLAFLLPWSGPHVRALAARRSTWVWVGVVGAAGCAAAAWIVLRDATDLGDYSGDRDLTASQAWLVEVERWPRYLEEAVGVTGWLDTRMSGVFYLAWTGVAVALLVGALVAGGRTDRWRLGVLAAGGLGVPAWLEVRNANETGFITQGRYLLPVLAGIALFAAFVLEERGLDARRSRSAVRLATVVLLPIHLVCLVHTMARWQRGLPEVGVRGLADLDPFAGDWQPVVGSLLPLVLHVAGLLVVGVLCWRASGREGSAAPGPGELAQRQPPEDRRDRAGGGDLGDHRGDDRVARQEQQGDEQRGADRPGEGRAPVDA